jgi:hypothetical protein
MKTYSVVLVVDSGGEPEDDEQFHFSINAADKRLALDAAMAVLKEMEPKKALKVWCWFFQVANPDST